MDSNLEAAEVLAQKLKYSGDTLTRHSEGDSQKQNKLLNRLYQTDLKISPYVTPALADRLNIICDRLQIPSKSVGAFIYASPEIQAECYSGSTSDCIVRVSSALVDLLTDDEFEFVIGHELGHFLLGHGLVRIENYDGGLEISIQQRKQEISADRIGLFACKSIDTAVHALMKTVSGLSSEHLRFDVGSFLSQLKNVREEAVEMGEFSTHPSILIRCRALLWFSMDDLISRGIEHLSLDRIATLDQRIDRDFSRFVDGPADKIIAEAKNDLSIWEAARVLVERGNFSKSDQLKFENVFGKDVSESMKNFLTTISASDIEESVLQRLQAERETLEQIIPLSFERSVKEIKSRIEHEFSNE